MSAAFFDTNLIVYAADTDSADPDRRDLARHLLLNRTVTVSTQVLMELYAVLRRKLGYAPEAARDWIQILNRDTVAILTAADVIEAIDTARRFEISHWDALILRAAEKSGLDLVYTEDLNHGQMYGPVRVCNPFIEDFLA
ncbi:MAG: PIN domain-containing protein [Alphaproteobacteria bacterium]|nr:PIN domain-containing protein [Alphaproteobacteria bacterium]